jgi:hypothetical protein
LKNVIVFMLITLIILVGLRCEKNENPFKPDSERFVYPIQIGYRWIYTRTLSYSNFRPFTPKAQSVGDTTASYAVTIEIARRETIHDSIETHVFQEVMTDENGQTFESETYYANLDSGLYLFAYYGPSQLIPKSGNGIRIDFKGMFFPFVHALVSSFTSLFIGPAYLEDSLTYEIPPLRSIAYPLEIGSQWTYRYPGEPCRMDKKVVGRGMEVVPAGELQCFQIQWLLDMDRDGEWDDDILFYDYIADIGLIRRYILINDCVIIGEDDPEPIGVCDILEESVLTGFYH